MRVNNELWSAGNAILSIAEELAEAKYGKDYYDLTEAEQSALYEQAMQVWREEQQ